MAHNDEQQTNMYLSLSQSSLKRLTYLLDVHSFPPSHLTLNHTVLTWPARLPAIFEQGERIVEESKTRGEASLREKQERVAIEIEKVKKHVCVKTGMWQYNTRNDTV